MKMDKHQLVSTLRIMIMAIALIAIGALVFSGVLISNYKDEIVDKLNEVSRQEISVLQKEIVNTQSNLNHIANMMETLEADSGSEDYIEVLKQFYNESGFATVGLLNMDGTGINMNGESVDYSKENFFDDMIKGENFISDSVKDSHIDENVIVFSVPIKKDNTQIGVVYATYTVDYFMEIIEMTSFNGEGYSYVVRQDGTAVVASSNKNSFQSFENVFASLSSADDRNEKAFAQMQEDMEKGTYGYIKFYNKVSKYMFYRSTGVNDWYLLTVVPASVLDTNMNFVIRCTVITDIVILAMLLCILGIFYKMQISSRKVIEDMAYVDKVTGGLSYDKFKMDADDLIRNAASKNKKYAMISIDIDKFKYINEIFGYEEGDEVIRFIHSELDKISFNDEIFAHKRADQFLFLMEADDQESLIRRVELLAKNIMNARINKNRNYEIVLSIGIYIVHDSDMKIQHVIDRSEITKRTIKGKHGVYYAMYDDSIRKKILREKEIENQMEKALANNEFIVYYQPKYDAHTKKVVGAEALVRWLSPTEGFVMPSDFIPLFESNGFITQLDKHVFKTVCENMRSWIDQNIKVVPVSVNLSQQQLYNVNFVEEYNEIMKKYNIPSQLLQLELTETTFFNEKNTFNDIIDRLHMLGFKILMDDFGTGYSSLNMLKDVNVDVLKLDKSFVDDIGNRRGDRIIETIVTLGQSLNMRIVAEGVETEGQYEFLKGIYCDEIQGYYFSKPVSEEEYIKKLEVEEAS